MSDNNKNSNIQKNKKRPLSASKVGKGNGCTLYKKCGGCQLQNMTYPEQLSFKQVKAIRSLGSFGHVEEIIGMENPTHYRNKVQAAFGYRNGRIISGVYQSSSHNIVPVNECMLEDKVADSIIVSIRRLLPKYKLTTYNEDTGRGFLRHVLVKRSFATAQTMVVLVSGTPLFPKKEEFVKELLTLHGEITTVIHNINGAKTSLVLGEKEIVLYGDGYIEDRLCGKTFRISAKSFYQINPLQTQVLYGKAIEFADLTGNERVLDAYCGTGTIGIVASDAAKEVIGVELNEQAVRDARVNAKLNKVDNIRFFTADAGKFMVEAAKAGETFDTVFMDPPRAGSDLNFLKSVVTLSPNKIVYVSCNVETQERDLRYLCKNGYRVKKIQPVDMFPHTAHVETVVQLVRKNPDTHIDFEIGLDEFDLAASGAKATCQEIKDYVLDKFGLKVSSLNISQVKTKCGIIERENYNKCEGRSRVPQCPKEKEKAIINALRHFKMI
ncbi:MAG: 23S rRNA (uracil(1939)-C(5))-methyltransferase RlmD [Clostridia bacterium]|nr:23S rRNA (uracil(1939)-C(5))-methyltransferase RlmD [Clostridia bacterium]